MKSIQIPVEDEKYWKLLKMKDTKQSWYKFFKIDELVKDE